LSFVNELKRRNVFRVGIAYIVVAWLIIQVVDVVINNIGTPQWVFQTILLLLGIGLPLVLIFAWAFEMTPEGLKREREVDRSESITTQTGRKLDFTIIGILVLALGYFAADKFILTPERDTVPLETTKEQPATESRGEETMGISIAVLPLANRSAREEDQYFTDGIHDDLLTQLAKIASLKVISRTSVMRYRDTEMSIPEIAEQLGVTSILEGGIQRSGDQIRINVQLIDTQTDEHLWAETYDRQMTAENLFAIQSEITRQITDSLKATLTPEEAERIDERPTDSLEAFQEYMKGQQLLALRTVTGIEEGKQHFEKAIELDPEFAEALTGLANAYHLLFEYAGWPEDESLDVAMDLLNQALVLSPELGEAYMVRGELYRHRDDLDASEADFERAMELIPGNATVAHWFSFLRAGQNRKEESYALIKRAHELDPMSRVIHVAYAIEPFFDGHDEKALAELARVKLLHPDYPAVYSYESWIYWSHGDPVEGLRANLKIVELDPTNTRAGFHCYNYLTLNAEESALDCLARDKSPRAMGRIYVRIVLHLINGNRDTALAVLESTQDMEGSEERKAEAALAAGNFEMARPYYEKEYSEWFTGSAPVSLRPFDIEEAIDVALILQRSGEDKRAKALLNAALEAIEPLERNRGFSAYGTLDVQAYALLGEPELALAAMEECAEIKYLSNWQAFKYLPHYDSIRNDPRFSAALSRLSAAADEARKRATEEGLL
jgi:TolB-like protein